MTEPLDAGWDYEQYPEPPDWLDEVGDFDDPAEVAAQAIAAGADAPPTAHLPDEFWESRPLFKTIRQAAHARGRSADAVLGCALARVSAMVSPTLHFDVGLGPGSLNLFVALIGGPATGKSQANKIATRLIETPEYLQGPGAFYDGIGIGSGEGLAEIYMGMTQVEVPGRDGGEPQRRTMKAQVRQNVHFYIDEGETLITQMKERKGATLGQAIRSAWFAHALGQANASQETTRILAADSYSMGMVVGFQQEPAAALLEGASLGTPQRFLWLSADDPNIPHHPSDPPDPIRLPFGRGNGFGQSEPRGGTIGSFEALRIHIWQITTAPSRGDIVVESLNEHLSMMRCKIAAIFAFLDDRMRITEDDWRLASLVVATSCAIRDRVREFAIQLAAKEAERRIDAAVEREVAVTLAKQNIDKDVMKHATRIQERVASQGTMTRKMIRDAMFNSKTRRWLDPAIEHAVSVGWIVEDGPNVFKQGSSQPRPGAESAQAHGNTRDTDNPAGGMEGYPSWPSGL